MIIVLDDRPWTELTEEEKQEKLKDARPLTKEEKEAIKKDVDEFCKQHNITRDQLATYKDY